MFYDQSLDELIIYKIYEMISAVHLFHDDLLKLVEVKVKFCAQPLFSIN